MSTTIIAFLTAVLAVTLAEMGDKTQLLAMAFACKYKASKVLAGVFIATVFNHALAVAVGNFIAKQASIQTTIQAVAALSFVFFGLWTIRGDKLEGEENRITKFGAVFTVSVAFFIAELGDKTQLATIALATKFPDNPVGILIGTTTGMMIADAIGIWVGVLMCKRIPERTVKLVSAGAFIVFGLIGCFQVGYSKLNFGLANTLGLVAVIAAVTGIVAYYLIKNAPKVENDVVAEYCKVRNTKLVQDNE